QLLGLWFRFGRGLWRTRNRSLDLDSTCGPFRTLKGSRQIDKKHQADDGNGSDDGQTFVHENLLDLENILGIREMLRPHSECAPFLHRGQGAASSARGGEPLNQHPANYCPICTILM